MSDSNRSLLAELAKERMEREAKKRRVEDPAASNADVAKPNVTCSGDVDPKVLSNTSNSTTDDVVLVSTDEQKTKAEGAAEALGDEVVILPDDEVEETPLQDCRDDAISSVNSKKAATSPWELKILTYNVWFEVSVCLIERMGAIGEIIEDEQPDIIMMQEVVPEMELLFNASTWFKNYEPSRRPQGMPYYTLLFVHKSIEILSPSDRHCFDNSQMGRDLLSVCVNVRGKPLVVATTHLESLTEYKPGPAKDAQLAARKQQLAEAQQRLEVYGKRLEGAMGEAPEIILAGDLNWNDQETGKPALRDGWADPWPLLYPRDPGYTYDGPRNPMLVNKFRNRLDRFLCRLQAAAAASLRMVGTDPLPGVHYQRAVAGQHKTLPVAPSDHFGLLATFLPPGAPRPAVPLSLRVRGGGSGGLGNGGVELGRRAEVEVGVDVGHSGGGGGGGVQMGCGCSRA